MVNTDKKDFNAMLHKENYMPKIQMITDIASIKKYGGCKMYFAPAIAYDELMKKIPFGKIRKKKDLLSLKKEEQIYVIM